MARCKRTLDFGFDPFENTQLGKALKIEPELCKWFALCDHPATSRQPHPILGEVPICNRCAAKLKAIEAKA